MREIVFVGGEPYLPGILEWKSAICHSEAFRRKGSLAFGGRLSRGVMDIEAMQNEAGSISARNALQDNEHLFGHNMRNHPSLQPHVLVCPCASS